MIKILHTGDIHLGDLNGPTKDGINLRRQDTLNCMNAICETAKRELPDVTIIAGDLFNRSRVWADTALEDVNDALDLFIRPLCRASNYVVLLFGTMNHDNPRAFEVIRKATEDIENLRIYTEPNVEYLNIHGKGPVQIVAVPGFDKGRLRLFCPGDDKEAENRNATALINDVVLGLATQLDPRIPSVLVAHYTVAGCETESGSTFLAGQDVVLTPATIDATGVTLACLGHIHKPQKLVCSTPAYYCGSPNQLTFNDEGQQSGVWMHTIDTEAAALPYSPLPVVESRFIDTPARQHKTIRIGPDEVQQFITTGTGPESIDVKDCIVRVKYACSSEQDKAFNRGEYQKALMAGGAFFVAEITPEQVEDLNAKDEITEHDGPAESLSRWLEKNDVPGQKALELVELAAPIIKEADDGRTDGKHTGAFTPLSIEVKNYRSYTEAAFDFEKVHMAMVNGQNGVGKSSLFMDAIADCLYEQTRKEDIGGWVRDGTKSGAITFTFSLGGQVYRVIRTRTKSGRGTLALQRFDDEAQSWVDESDSTMKLTQAKVERLLGMDVNTFCSVALIRQDAYGLFLDASSDRRMEVLSALLGLDIYNRMEEIARAKATNMRREIAVKKDRVAALMERAGKKEGLIVEDSELAASIDGHNTTIKMLEAQLKAAESVAALREKLVETATDKGAYAKDLRDSRDKKAGELAELNRQLAEAKQKAFGLRLARDGASAHEKALATMRRLEPDVERDKKLALQMEAANTESAETAASIKKAITDRSDYLDIIDQKPEIEKARAALAALNTRAEQVQTRVGEKHAAEMAVEAATAAVTKHVTESKAHIAAIAVEIKTRESEAERLKSSKCPVPDTASCLFLKSAVKAKAAIPDLQAELERVKEASRAKYQELMDAAAAAKAKCDALGDPAEEAAAIRSERMKYLWAEDMYPKLVAAETRVEALNTLITEGRKKNEDIGKYMETICDERNALMAAVKEYMANKTIAADNEQYAKMLPACEAAAAKMETLSAQCDTLANEVDELTRKVEEADRDAEAAFAAIPKDGQGEVDPEAAKGCIEQYRGEISRETGRRGEIKAKLDDIAKSEEQAATLRGEITQISATLDDYATLVQAFSLDGIQYMIIRGVVPQIMRQSNEILAAMTGGRMAVDIRTEREQKSTKQMVNSLEVWINSIDGNTRPYQSHSGGEKVKICLAVTLGLADVKARRAGIQLGMLFIDEPPFLDADGTDAYADALLNMNTRNPDMRILAISHDPTMKARFQENITVTAGENGSTAVME